MMNADFFRLPHLLLISIWTCFLFLVSNPVFSFSAPSVKTPDSLGIDASITQLITQPTKQNTTLKTLKKFAVKDFSEDHKNKISKSFANPDDVSKSLILFFGFLNIKNKLIALSAHYKRDKSYLQHINLALVRAGDPQKTEILYRNLLKLSINDDFVYEVLPLLIYTKQIKIYDWLLNVILSDDKNCHPADAEIPGNINCAYRIMEALAPNIIDFPIKTDKWGDLKTDNYSKTLKIVREWIEINQGNYKINTQTY